MLVHSYEWKPDLDKWESMTYIHAQWTHKHYIEQNKPDINVCVTYNSIYMKHKQAYAVRTCREIWVPFQDVKRCITSVVIVQIKV